MFTQNKEDKKRIETVLQTLSIPTGKTDTVCSEKFTFDLFLEFYIKLTKRADVEKVFNEM